MAQDVSETVRNVFGNVLREAVKNVGDATPSKKKSGPFSGVKGVATGVGLAAAAPLAKKGVDAVRGNGKLSPPSPGKIATKAASKAGDKVGAKVKDAVSSKVDEAGGAGGLVKEAAGGLLPGLGGDNDGGKNGMQGVGKGRRMPVQQSIDVAVPLETAYNQWTQFEDWPEYMHRVTRVTQEDDCTVSFATKIWGKTKEFTADIETQRPDERIKWRVSQGITHTGVVTFHELAPRLTRIELSLYVDPGSLIEKAARGMRHIKRAARADLHRFKAFIEMQEIETGAWRGTIEEGEVTEEHDPSYDEGREYSDVEDLKMDEDSDEDEDQDEEEEEEERPKRAGNGTSRQRTQRFKSQAERTRATSRSGSSRTTGGRSSGSGSGGSGSGGSRSSGSGSSGSKSSGSSNRRSSSSGKSGSSRSSSGSRSSGSSRGGSKSSSSSRRKSTSRSS
jgi:uncharacterized membrane protein